MVVLRLGTSSLSRTRAALRMAAIRAWSTSTT